MNTAKMKRAFHSCYLVPKYNLTTSKDIAIELFAVHFFYSFIKGLDPIQSKELHVVYTEMTPFH